MTRISLVFTGIAVALAFGVQATGQTPAPQAGVELSGDPEVGKKLYTSYGCWQCHGYEGQGGAAGPRLAPDPVPLAAFKSYVRRPTGQMPLYTTRVVEDDELDDIHAFLQTLQEPPPLESLPLLQQ